MKLLLFFLSLSFMSCFVEDEPEYIPANNRNQEERDEDTTSNDSDMNTLSFLALGDSYTIGESVAEKDRWPVQLATRLQENDVELSDPRIIARTGWTTNELKGAIDASELDSPYDLVSLLIGVNNQYRGYPISQQEKEFEELLKMAIEFAGSDPSKVFVVSIPDWGVTPFAEGRDSDKIAKDIDEYNRVNYEIAQRYKVQYFNITPISREAKNDASLVADDGLHPSGEMYTRWVELIYPWAEEILAE